MKILPLLFMPSLVTRSSLSSHLSLFLTALAIVFNDVVIPLPVPFVSSFGIGPGNPSLVTSKSAAATASAASAAALQRPPRSAEPRQGTSLTSTNSAMSTDGEDPGSSDGLTMSPSAVAELVDFAVSFSAANGLQVEVAAASSSAADTGGRPKKQYTCAPISLLPNAFPSPLFRKARLLAPPLNLLVDRISRDGEFLRAVLRDVRRVDDYTGRLLDLYERIYMGIRVGMDADAAAAPDMEWGKFARAADRLGIQRSDYMLHEAADGAGDHLRYSLKQVELNTIASSFAGLASSVARMHSLLIQRFVGAATNNQIQQFLKRNEAAIGGDVDISADLASKGVPESPALLRLPAALALAHERYKQRFLSSDDSTTQPIVLFVVQPGETNTVDQRMLEFALWNNHDVPVVRMSLAQIHEKIMFDNDTGAITLPATHSGTTTPQEVTVVYFRAGYAPTDYPSSEGIEWHARETLERSRATKCPSLGYHLAGTKKVQQELARGGVVERFFPEETIHSETGENDTSSFVRSAFAGLYSLGEDANADDKEAVRHVLLHGGQDRYVLKPQREGGGYNYYGQKLADKLGDNCTITEDGNVMLRPELSEFILMERLFPPQQTAILLRNGIVEGEGNTISELGCFGTILVSGDGSNVISNDYAGFLLRTKFMGVDEGGVASGFATLSSPYLC